MELNDDKEFEKKLDNLVELLVIKILDKLESGLEKRMDSLVDVIANKVLKRIEEERMNNMKRRKMKI